MTLSKKTISILLIVLMTIITVLGTTAESFAFETFSGKSPFSSTGYSTYKHNKDKFDGCEIKNGIDISAWQDPKYFDFAKAKNAGVDFAIIKVSGTGYTNGNFYEDSNWKDHFKKARDAGIKIGLYHFSQAKTKTEAKKEVNYACDKFEAGIKEMYGDDNAKKYLDLPFYMDYEYAGGSAGRLYNISKKSTTKATSCAKQFCETMKERGYKPGIYASSSFLSGDNRTIDGEVLGESYEIWAAQYWNKCQYEGKYSKWQYSSSAKIAGLVNSAGNKVKIDVNYWYVGNGKQKEEAEKKEEPKKEQEPEQEASAEPKPVITPTTLKTLTSGKKKFAATWTKQKKSKVDGYQIQYSRFKDMSNDLKKKVKSYKTTSGTFKTNFRKYKYYVRIRTYKAIDGTTYYSKWSAKKTVKVK